MYYQKWGTIYKFTPEFLNYSHSEAARAESESEAYLLNASAGAEESQNL